MAEVVLDGIRKEFGARREQVTALANVTLSVADGELVAIVGPSGSGKTTLLRVVAGLERPTAGVVKIEGRVVNAVAPQDRDVALVFQNYALYPHRTAFGNMAFGLKMRGISRSEVTQRVNRAAALLGISHLLDRRPDELSGGEQQRVALGRAIVREPKAFLLDEPLSNLDAPQRHHMRAEVKALHRRLGATMLYVTHDQEEAMALGDRVVVMRSGRIEQVGTPREVYEHPTSRFVAGFFGSGTMNFLEGTIERNDQEAWFVWGEGRLPLGPRIQGGPAVLGVRPQHVSLRDPQMAGILDASLTFLSNAVVETIEWLGEVSQVGVRTERGIEIVARVSPQTGLAVDQNVTVWIDTQNGHWF